MIRKHKLSVRPEDKGFTLLELLVVILVVSLGTVIAVVQVDNNRPYRLRMAVKELVSNVALLSDEAVLANQQWGIDLFREVDSDGVESFGYRWLLKGEDAWVESTPAFMENNRMIPERVTATLEVEGLNQDIGSRQDQESVAEQNPLQPDIWLFSSGEITPFTLLLSDSEVAGSSIRVSADQLARITVIR